MDKQKYMLYRERKKLAEEYEEWVKKPLEDGSKIKDCPLSVITFMLIKGFCKIPENAVVLKREEYNEYEKCKDLLTQYVNGEIVNEDVFSQQVDDIKKASKETAEKFARLVEFHSVSTRDNDGREIFTISALGLKEILHEEFGIPYDEICKGITK
jgi:hypothetical protein